MSDQPRKPTRGGYTGSGEPIPGPPQERSGEFPPPATLQFDPQLAGYSGWRKVGGPIRYGWDSPTSTHTVRYALEFDDDGNVKTTTTLTVRGVVVYDGPNLSHSQVMERLEEHGEGFVASRSIAKKRGSDRTLDDQ